MTSVQWLIVLLLLTCMPNTAREVELGVAWLPTPSDGAQSALRWADVGKGDMLFELGCGDARVSIEAARLGARAVCVEADPLMVAEAERAVLAAGVESSVRVLQADLFRVDLSSATVVYLFLLPEMNAKLVPALDRLRPGARVLSREFEITGWPCGRRLKLPGYMFLRWQLPVLRLQDSRVSSQGIASGDPTRNELEEHILECAVDDD